MKFKVQGETYDSVEDLVTAIGEISAQVEDLPETHPGRADLEIHRERLIAALPFQEDEDAPLESPPQAEAEAGDDPGSLSVSPPQPPSDEPDSDEDLHDVPDGYKPCPVCKGGGLVTEDAPVSNKYEQCPGCNGYGSVLTGSFVEGHTTKTCDDCQGSGYIQARATFTAANGEQRAAPAAGWPGSTWDATEEKWNPPAGDAPWTGAEWDSFKGTYV